MRIYLDNAASMPMRAEAVEAMLPYLTGQHGNPSAVHAEGRQAKAAIEQARKTIAELLHCRATELVFTSGGSEANTMAILGAARTLGVRKIISSPIEHACVLQSIATAQKEFDIELQMLRLLPDGSADLQHLRELLSENTENKTPTLAKSTLAKPTLVSLIHAHNELASINNIEEIAQICKSYGTYLHCDMVQTIGHLPINLGNLSGLNFASASAHKFGGAKGSGFLYVQQRTSVAALIQGGGQERKLRGGTENVAGIVAMAAALQAAHKTQAEEAEKITALRQYFIAELNIHCPAAFINGAANENYLYSVLNIALPYAKPLQTLLFALDLAGVAASAGAACSSGAVQSSPVQQFLQLPDSHKAIRFSFSAQNTKAEIAATIAIIRRLVVSK
jgi:cysteine desulfurase